MAIFTQKGGSQAKHNTSKRAQQHESTSLAEGQANKGRGHTVLDHVGLDRNLGVVKVIIFVHRDLHLLGGIHGIGHGSSESPAPPAVWPIRYFELGNELQSASIEAMDTIN